MLLPLLYKKKGKSSFKNSYQCIEKTEYMYSRHTKDQHSTGEHDRVTR